MTTPSQQGAAKQGPQPRPGILEISPYVGGEAKLPGFDRVIKLASNEGPFGPSPKVVEAIRAAAPKVHLYPDGGATRLRRALAEAHGLEMARIVCGTGSDEILALLARAYAGPGDEVVISEHEFLIYRLATLSAGATPVDVPMTDGLVCDVDAMLAAVTARTRLVFIANPNNPVGTYVTAADMERLAAALPAHCLLVIDSAYAEYVEADDYGDGLDLARRYPNVITTRTFSKIYALGGLRLGWAYGGEAVIDVLNRVRGVFNVTSLSEEAGLAALADTDFLQHCRDHNRQWRDWFAGELRALGLEVGDSAGNFVLVHFNKSCSLTAQAADAYLRGRGIIVRRMTSYGFEDALRITIGSEEEIKACLDALADFMAGSAA